MVDLSDYNAAMESLMEIVQPEDGDFYLYLEELKAKVDT